MANDLRAKQIRTNQIIASGSVNSASLFIYGAGAATNLSGEYNSSLLTGVGSDVFLFVSGSTNSSGTSNRGVTLAGGDFVASGTIKSNAGISGSLTRLFDGKSYLVAGSNVTITSESNGQVSISSIGGSPGGSDTYLQFNDAGSFGGASDLTFKKTSKILTLTGSLASTGSIFHSGSVAFGSGSKATGIYSVATGESTTASGKASHTEGSLTTASGQNSHAEGTLTTASGLYSHAEGQGTVASAAGGHAEGLLTTAAGSYTHTEGYYTVVASTVSYSHTEGILTRIQGTHTSGSHAEGYGGLITAAYAHVEGYLTTGSGVASHAEGSGSIAVGVASHAGGINTIASGTGQTVYGSYNKRGNTTSYFVIGNGSSDSDNSRSDVLRVESRGIEVTGSVYASLGLSGSLTQLHDGRSYLVAGTNVTITSESNGQVTIASTGGSGSPGGSDTYVQFNDSSTFGGDAGLTYDKTTDTLTGVTIKATGGLSGSLTRLADGTPYLLAGPNITINSSSNGSIQITGSAGSGGSGNWNELSPSPRLNTTASVSIAGERGSSYAAQSAGPDVFFFVSGTIDSRGTSTAGTAVFGGDTLVSGSLFLASNTTSGYSTLANSAGSLEIRNRTLGGTFVASVNTTIGNTANFLDVRPNGMAVNTKVAILPSIYAGPASPFTSTDTNFFVGGTAGSKGGSTGGTSVFGGDLQISGSTYIGTDSSNSIYFLASVATDILPDANRVRNLGSNTLRFANMYTGDLHLQNERGDYTLIEEEDCLTIRFNKTRKRYRFVLEPAPEFDEQ